MPTLPKGKRPYWVPPPEVKPYSNDQFYQTQQWKNIRNKYIREHPLCEECKRQGRVTAGYAVDHIIPIRKGGSKTDERNLQTLCKRHHAIKTGKERHE